MHRSAAPQLLRQVVPPDLCAQWLAAAADAGADGGRGSLPLSALPGLHSPAVLQAVAAGALGPLLEAALGPAPWCDIDQSWLRHGRPPHSWHQDGALRHDFPAHAGQPAPADAALEMRTAWIALTPCGNDAPSLQWIAVDAASLLLPAALTDAAVAVRHAPASHAHACMAAGDALLFDGLLLHRTHVTAGMQQRRTSLELRFFRADQVPARVAGDAGLRLPRCGPGRAVPLPWLASDAPTRCSRPRLRG